MTEDMRLGLISPPLSLYTPSLQTGDDGSTKFATVYWGGTKQPEVQRVLENAISLRAFHAETIVRRTEHTIERLK